MQPDKKHGTARPCGKTSLRVKKYYEISPSRLTKWTRRHMELKLQLSEQDIDTISYAKSQGTNVGKETLALLGDILLSSIKL